MAKPELGTKRLCPNCGAKYYDLNRDPIVCPKCNAAFATGVVGTRPVTAKQEDDEVEPDDEGVELVALEEADEGETGAAEDEDNEIGVTEDDDVSVDGDDVLVDDDDDADEVSDVVRGSDDEEDER